jgi:hypothetical protein
MVPAAAASAATSVGWPRGSGTRSRGLAGDDARAAYDQAADRFAGFRMAGERRIVDALFDLEAPDFFSLRGGDCFVEVDHVREFEWSAARIKPRQLMIKADFKCDASPRRAGR